MKKVFILSSILALALVSCKENTAKTTIETEEQTTEDTTPNTEEYKIYSQEQIAEINSTIIEEKIVDKGVLLERFFPKDQEAEGNYSYQINVVSEEEQQTVIEIIEDGIMDDSIQAIKTIITIGSNNETLIVTEAKQSFKCKLNRGQQDWAAAYCQ